MTTPSAWSPSGFGLLPRSAASLALVLLLSEAAFGQTVPESNSDKPSDEVIVLSTFEVNTSADVGYQAGNTTSGSRLNSSLKDTAASVTAFTPEFMADFNLNSLEDMVAYSANMSVDMLDTSADASPQFIGGADFTDTRIRVRGLSASTSRDFFETKIAIDGYNTERVELSSGANSILFGIGSPGGLVNVMTKRASLLRNRTSFKTQFGDWDFSRFELDHNQVIIPKKVALRLNGLITDGNHWRKWDYNDTTRGTVSLRIEPFKNTVINVTNESGKFDGSVSRPFNAYDSLALWQQSGSPVINDTAYTNASRASGINRITATRAYYVSDGGLTAPYAFTTGSATTNRLLVSNFDDVSVPANNRAGLTLVGADLVPFSINTYGPGATRSGSFDRFTAAIEQRFTPQLTLELAYDHESTDQSTRAIQIANLTLNGDPNQTIPNPDGSASRVTNPHAGDLFLESRWVGDIGGTKTDVLRASLAWDKDLGKFGRHRIAAMGEHSEASSWRNQRTEIMVDEAGIPLFNATPQNANNVLWRRMYITPGDYNTYYAGNPDDNFTIVRNGKTYHNFMASTGTGGGLTERTNDALMAVTQSYFWNDRLIVTAGIRDDRMTIDSYGSTTYAADDPEVLSGREIVNSLKFADTIASTYDYDLVTESVGFVFHANRLFSLFFNRSNNNDAPRTTFRILPDETLPEPIKGQSTDYGFMLNLLDGKIFVRATAFETTQTKSVGGSFNIGLGATSGENNIVSPSTRVLDTLLANSIIDDATYVDHLIGDDATLSGSSDIKNTGYEASVWFNVTKNFTAVSNFSYTETDRTSIIPEFEPWFERENAFWHQTPGAGSLVNSVSALTIDQEAQGILDTIEGVREFYGQGYGVRPYSANLNGRYNFSSGPLKGLFVGGGARWQSKPVIGREYLGRTSAGLRILGDNLYGPEDFKLDAFIGYRHKLTAFKQQTDLTFQVNITNLTDEDTVMPLRYNQGETGYYRVLLRDPRRVRFTMGLAF